MNPDGIGLDHIGIVERDLGALENSFRDCGFQVAPRCELVRLPDDGSAVPLHQVNSHLVFENSYVELTAVTGDLSGHHLEQAISRYYGFHIVALLALDAEAENIRLGKSGLSLDPVAIAGRDIDYPGGSGMGRFRWFRVPDAAAPEAFFCFVQHLTPELVFDPALVRHPNGARELTQITLCVEDPASSAGRLAPICGTHVEKTGDIFDLPLARGTIRLVGPGQLPSGYGDLQLPALPFAAAFRLHVADLQESRAYFAEAGLDVEDHGDLLALPPRKSGHPIVEFV